MVQVNMLRADDRVTKIMLNIHQTLDQIPAVVVIDQDDGPGDNAPGGQGLLNQSAAHQLLDGFRASGMAFDLDQTVEIRQEFRFHRDTESDNTIHRKDPVYGQC